MAIIVGVVIAFAIFCYWITGHIAGLFLMWPIAFVSFIVIFDSTFGDVAGPKAWIDAGIIYLVLCAFAATAFAAAPTYLISRRQQFVSAQDRRRNEAANARWAGEWIGAHDRSSHPPGSQS
jgi:hypothetical protein